MNRLIRYTLLFLFFEINLFGQVSLPVNKINSTDVVTFEGTAQYLIDPSGHLTIQEVVGIDTFIPIEQSAINFDLISSPIWWRARIAAEADVSKVLLQYQHAIVDSIEVYTVIGDSIYHYGSFGDRMNFDTRPIEQPTFIFPFDFQSTDPIDVYLRFRSDDNMIIPIRAGSEMVIMRNLFDKQWFIGMYIGVLLVMFFYNAFIWLTTRDRSYLYYIAYIFSIGMAQLSLEGYVFQWIFQDYPGLYNFSIILFAALVGFSAIEFAKSFLHTSQYVPKFHKGLILWQLLYLSAVVLRLIGYNQAAFRITDIAGATVAIYALIFIIIVVRKGYRPAKFFLIAWIVFLIGLVIFVLRNFGILPYNLLTSNILQIGSGLEALLLSLALADRINILKREKEISQAQALAASLENERIIREQKSVLEEMVLERTGELRRSNQDLEDALNTLKEAQSQLVDAEKMASLGQLTAGIAHEINNPVNFISANISPLKRDIADLIELAQWLEEKIRESDNIKTIQELERFKKEIEFDYILSEIDDLLQGMADGTDRTVEIIKGLKIFSRVDEQDIKFVDLHEGLDSTLILLNNSIKDIIDLDREYGTLPKVECFAGKMNQVFMNIISNAVQAIKSNPSQIEKGRILLKTSYANNWVKIQIIDNGPGMPESVKAKIFEPFFTTKPVGEGTGLGLSIVYNIVKSHKGNIEVNSTPNVGTEFVITLPVSQQEA